MIDWYVKWKYDVKLKKTSILYCRVLTASIENRVYREEFTWKKCKTAILLYCFHTAGVLHIFMLYNALVSGISFYRKSKIIVKRKPNYEICWFTNWPLIISHRLHAFHFTNDIFRYNYKSNDVFIHLINFIKFI